MTDLDHVVRIGLLFDYYGSLLTARQREAIDLYYLRNWSLQEMAETWQTSRQAAHDLVGRSARILEAYERRLGFEARDRDIRRALGDCAGRIDEARRAAGCDAQKTGEALDAAAGIIAGLLGADENVAGVI